MVGFPDFLIIGAPKCGTTSLYHYLKDHPGIFLSSTKEPHFYSYIGEERPDWGIGNEGRYKNLFREAEPDQLCGEASTWYLYSNTAAEQIRRYAPDTKCIAILRQPIDRAYSGWSYRVQEGWETLDFEEAIEAEDQRIEEGAPWDAHYLHAGLYYEQVRRFYTQLGADQVRIFWFDDFTEDADAVVQKVLMFLGLDPGERSDTGTVHNRTSLPRSRTFSWLHAQMVSQLQNTEGLRRIIRRIFPPSVRSFFRDRLREWNERPRPSLDPAVRRRLTREVAPDIRKLGQFLGVDLSHWRVSK